MSRRALLVAALALLQLLWPAESRAEPHRVAVVVGANLAPPGRAPLRYAHQDARRVSEVLTAVSGFKPADIKLLFDPQPAELLAALDRTLEAAAKTGQETLLFFYYSGHADQGAIFPAGLSLAFGELRSRLDDKRVKLRLGLIDSCRGGSWTGTKGLKKVQPFDVDSEQQLANEGTVLIASSSGEENAHEAETFQGSFFTHHWNAGLRGAADEGRDGVVTLGEAFEYARALTIRDTAMLGQAPQRPSFRMQLTGRRDFPLSTLANQRTTLLFEQLTGPTEVVRLNDGIVLVETRAGAERIRLGLPPGGYLVRRRSSRGVYVRIISLQAGATTKLTERELERSTLSSGQAKGTGELDSNAMTWAGQRFFAGLALGVRHAPVIDPGLRVGQEQGDGVVMLRVSARLTDGLWWAAPLSLVFDAERPAAFNWLGWAGVPTVSGTRSADDRTVLTGLMGAGLDARLRQSERHTFNGSLSGLSPFELGKAWPGALLAQLTLGLSETIPDAVTFNVGAAVATNVLVDGGFASSALDSAERASVVAFGSVQRSGLRPLPLIHVPLGPAWGIDAYAVGAYLPAKNGWVETYLAGISYAN